MDTEYESIVTADRPTLVLAGPGAGKTYLLGDRVKRLLAGGTPREQIALLTFGKDAARHMRDKLLDPEKGFGIPYSGLPVTISTHHALALEIVNRKPRFAALKKTGLRVQPEENVKALLYRDAALALGHKEADATAARQCKAYGDCVIANGRTECCICRRYRQIMSKCNCIDFDDQVLFACAILESDPKLLQEYQQRCRHLLLDEYQDINAGQFRLIELLSRGSRDGLFVVGDDAQSIYGFRGADPKFILRFTDDFPGSWAPPLRHSRRCPKEVVTAAELVLRSHYPKWSGPYQLIHHVQAGDPPEICQTPSAQAEARHIARLARDAVAKNQTVLILAPKDDFFPLLSSELRSLGVPHQRPANTLPSAVASRLDTVFTIVEWLRDPQDSFRTRLAVERLINQGAARVAGARKGARCKPETTSRRVEVETEIARLWDTVDKERNLLSAIHEASPSPEVATVRDALRRLREMSADQGGGTQGEFAKALALATGAWGDPGKLTTDLHSLMHLLAAEQPAGFASVQLMTMRKAKGLEADVVLIVGLEDDIMPNPSSDVEEEARLFYVSMTRAKTQLHLVHSYQRPRNISFGPEILGKKRSRFLDSLGRPSKYLRASAR